MAKRGPKGTRKARIEKITSYLEVAGSYRVSLAVKKKFAEELDVTVRQIELDINSILTKIIEPKIEKIKRQFLLTLNSNLDDAHTLKRNTDPIIQARGITVANQTISAYTDFLEKFGFKEPIAQKLQHEGISTTITLIEKSVEEIKDAKNKSKRTGTDNKPEAGRNPEGSG